MSARTAQAIDEEPAPLDEQEAAFIDAEVERAVAPFRSSLPEADLAWMRERLADKLREDPSLHALVRAATPRSVDESGEVLRTRPSGDR